MNLCTPLDDSILGLRAGDRVTLSGIVYTARDRAHARMIAEGIPFRAEGAVIYHCGPLVRSGEVIAAGPTTSTRMEPFIPALIDAGVKGIIGKGGVGRATVEAMKGRCVYFVFTGGCAALAASRMRLGSSIWEDLGMAEAIWVLELDRLPLVVAVDSWGGDLFEGVRQKAERVYREKSYRNDDNDNG